MKDLLLMKETVGEKSDTRTHTHPREEIIMVANPSQ